MLTLSIVLGALLGILGLIVLDVLTKVAVSLARGRFDWGELLRFLRTNVLPYVICYGGVLGLTYLAQTQQLPSEVVLPFQGLAALFYAFIVARLIASIFGNFQELGLPATPQTE